MKDCDCCGIPGADREWDGIPMCTSCVYGDCDPALTWHCDGRYGHHCDGTVCDEQQPSLAAAATFLGALLAV